MNHFTSLLVRNLLNNDHNLPEFESVLQEVFRQQREEAANDVLSYELESTVPWLREIQARGQGGLKEQLQVRKKDRHQGDH